VIGCGFLSANCHPPIECGDAAHARGRSQFGRAGGDGCHVADCRRRRRCGRMRRGILRRGSKRTDWNGSLPCPVSLRVSGSDDSCNCLAGKKENKRKVQAWLASGLLLFPTYSESGAGEEFYAGEASLSIDRACCFTARWDETLEACLDNLRLKWIETLPKSGSLSSARRFAEYFLSDTRQSPALGNDGVCREQDSRHRYTLGKGRLSAKGRQPPSKIDDCYLCRQSSSSIR
jgi:hypothetical protein